jgi:flagellar basal-body rod protein FlgC
MGLFDAIDIAGTGMSAERLSMDVTSENLANAQTTAAANGQPYQRQDVVLQQIPGSSFGAALSAAMGTGAPGGSGSPDAGSGSAAGGVEVAKITADPSKGQLVYDPGNPAANGSGYVQMPNVNSVTEMVNLISESRSYEADVTAMQTAKTMFSSTLDVLK